MKRTLNPEDEKRVRDRLNSDFQYLVTLGYKVLGVFLQGSQNYGLHYEGSDIDTKAIVLPTLDDLVFNRKPVSTTLILPSNEHIDVKDIRLMHDCFRKQNINFIEILFTPYRVIDMKFVKLYQPMFENAEKIAHLNEVAAINCMVGMIYEKYKAMEHPYPATIDKIENYGYDPKQLHHILRCRNFLYSYVHGAAYEDCLVFPEDVRKYLVDVKRCPPIYSLEEAREIAAEVKAEVDELKPSLIAAASGFKEDVGQLMNNCLAAVIKTSLQEDLQNGR